MTPLALLIRRFASHMALAAALAIVIAPRANAQIPSGLNPTRYGVVYDVPATRDVRLFANVPYWSDATHSLAIDVYLPPGLPKGKKLPAVVFLNTIGDRAGDSLKNWGIYRTWPRLIATQGMIGISMQADSADVQGSLRRLFAFLESGRAPEGVDGQRVGVYAASANVTGACRFLLAADAPRSIRAAVL